MVLYAMMINGALNMTTKQIVNRILKKSKGKPKKWLESWMMTIMFYVSNITFSQYQCLSLHWISKWFRTSLLCGISSYDLASGLSHHTSISGNLSLDFVSSCSVAMAFDYHFFKMFHRKLYDFYSIYFRYFTVYVQSSFLLKLNEF